MFSKIDLLSGFHQLRMSEDAVRKTAFATPSGLYEFVSAPFGLTSVPGAFQRFMRERVLFIGTQFSILYTFMYSPA